MFLSNENSFGLKRVSAPSGSFGGVFCRLEDELQKWRSQVSRGNRSASANARELLTRWRAPPAEPPWFLRRGAPWQSVTLIPAGVHVHLVGAAVPPPRLPPNKMVALLWPPDEERFYIQSRRGFRTQEKRDKAASVALAAGAFSRVLCGGGAHEIRLQSAKCEFSAPLSSASHFH